MFKVLSIQEMMFNYKLIFERLGTEANSGHYLLAMHVFYIIFL